MGFYEGQDGPAVAKAAKSKSDGFKKGGGCMKKGGKAVMSKAAKAKPARASGGGVLSSASSGTPRGKASHY
jgi:hypothetical protein